MSLTRVVEALGLPPGARVDRRVPKTLLLEHGAPTSADKRQIQDGIEAIVWVAALKPSTAGVPVFRDDVREYVEVAVTTVSFRPQAKATRLTELIHRAIPYPVVLVSESDERVAISLAHKRWSLGQSGEVVIESVERTGAFRPDRPSPTEAAFLASLALAGLPRADLYTLYQGWIDRVSALSASVVTGTFTLPQTAEAAATRREALLRHAELQREIATLRASARGEKQVNRLVDLNLAIQRLEAERAIAAGAL